MDNCRIHKSPVIQEICDTYDIQLEFLPPYCPEFNPIEQSFHDLKAYIRKAYKPQGGSYDNFYDFLATALRERGRGPEAARRARAHFRHSGYNIVPAEDE
jgi:transposase